MDWSAIQNSEVMMNYLESELKKMASCQKPSVDEQQIVNDFKKFEGIVNKDPALKFTFKKLQEKFADDPEYASQVNPKFVEGVMLLNLDEQE